MQSIISELKFYPKTAKNLIEYLTSNNVDLKTFMSIQFEYQLGHLLTYIRSKDITIYADDRYYTVFYTGKEKMLTKKDGITLSERINVKPDFKSDIISTYYCAVIDAIRFIEIPF